MQNLFINESAVVIFVLILLRVSSFLMSSCIFNSNQIPVPIKIIFSLSISSLLYFKHQNLNIKIDALIILLSVKEVLIGLILGLVTRFFFHALAMGSELISMSLGLNSASIYNPMSGINSSLIEQFQSILGILVFLSIQGHHLLITGISQSFDMVPLYSVNNGEMHFISAQGVGEFVYWSKNLFEMALKIAAPVVSSLFLVNLSMGIIGRVVPQINVFVTSFQVTIMVGFLILIISMPLFLGEMMSILDLTQTQLFKLIRTL